MSTRQSLVDLLVERLSAVPALGDVTYWKAARMAHGQAATDLRDVSSGFVIVNNVHEHRVRIEIESYVYGEELGAAMNARVVEIFQALSAPLPRAVLRPLETRSVPVGDGQEAGAVGVVFELAYRAPAWDL